MNDLIKSVLDKLSDNSYVVGGYVRDYLLGISSFDVDICTSLRPEEVARIFKSSFNQFGVVSFRIDEYNFDVASFRTEANYQRRRPQVIEFCDNLEEDLKRRDFTINTICMDKFGNIIDLYNGCNDLKNKVIRMVGNISDKLKEDPLRILRAIRFATLLDFTIESELSDYICDNSYLIGSLSKNRIREEMDKILSSKNALYGIDLLNKLGILKSLDLGGNNVFYVDNLYGMWAQLNFFNMPFTNIEKKSIINITEVVNNQNIDNRILYKYNIDDVLIAAKIMGISEELVINMYNSLPIKSIKDIKISSFQIKELLGINNVSDIYNELALLILDKKLENDYIKIKEYLKKK